MVVVEFFSCREWKQGQRKYNSNREIINTETTYRWSDRSASMSSLDKLILVMSGPSEYDMASDAGKLFHCVDGSLDLWLCDSSPGRPDAPRSGSRVALLL